MYVLIVWLVLLVVQVLLTRAEVAVLSKHVCAYNNNIIVLK